MVAIDKCSELSKDEIKEQIVIRKNLVMTMVGNLYPQIINDEIRQLENLYNVIN